MDSIRKHFADAAFPAGELWHRKGADRNHLAGADQAARPGDGV
jgi:hypothetical protein